MVVARLLYAEDLVVGLDYGHFYLRTYREEDMDLDDDPEITEIIGWANDNDGIAQTPRTVVVISPHQNNFAMPLRLEAWSGPPPDDTADWPEAFEVHLDIGNWGDLSYDSPPEHNMELNVVPGAYHALITGRGFVQRGWPGSTTPGDSWRIRVWPSDGPQAPRRLSAWHAPGD
jgi:hypothetical protein